ncbi:FHA domain-containing protein [Stackebrandtia soli]|uniref:FHA domain-containing protein FhaB/FipA n=1 Tax=Stackebrandtia soli TaxID=1892856 RepID=UPI0039E90D9C
MPELVFTVARFGVLILLWVFVFAVARAIRRDVFAGASGTRAAAPAMAAGRGGGGRSSAPKAARTLFVTEGDRRGTTLPLQTAPIRIGRASDSTLVINDDFASSRHAQLVPRGGQWILEDLGSTNGTYLGRARVTGPTPVPLGVPIRIGRTSIELRP